MITCCDIPSYLNSFPPTWRKELTTLLCQIIGNNSTVSCDAVKSCETLTLVSNLTLDGSNILSFTYYDEQGVANYRSVDLSSLSGGGGSSYVFNNGLTESGGVVKFGGSLLANTSLTTGGFSLNIQSTDGNLLIDNEVIEFDYETIQFSNQTNLIDDSGTFTPSAFYYPDVNGNLRVAPLTYITDLIPIVPVYTASQGVSKNTLDFRLGDTAVSGTGDSANPITSHRDFTDSGGDFRFSFKNNRVLFGSDNAQDLTNSKINIVGNSNSESDNSLIVRNSALKVQIKAQNNGNIDLGTIANGTTPFLTVNPVATSFTSAFSLVYYTDFVSGSPLPFKIDARGGDIPIWFSDGYSCKVDKHVFQTSLNALNTTQFANIKIVTNTSLTHEGSVYNGTSNIAELQLTHFNSDYPTTAIPKLSGLLINGSYVMPSSYATGEVNFISVKPSYTRSTQTSITGTSPLRGFYYAPTISGVGTPAVTNEIAFESTRGSVVIGNGSTKDTLRLPSLTTVQRDTVAALTTIGEISNAAKLVYNSDNKFVEYHNGLGWVTQTPETLASGSVGWNACNTNKDLTLNANTTVTITNLVPGSTLVLTATQDAVGARTLTILASGFTIKTAGTLSATALDTSLINIYVKSTSELLVSIVTGYV